MAVTCAHVLADGVEGPPTGLDDHPEHERLVLVVDQFEELLVTTAPALRAAFLQQLVSLTVQEPTVTVIVGLRDDIYGRLAAAAPGLMRLVGHATVNVPAVLEADELAAIIQRPAAAVGVSLEPNLAERIARDATTATASGRALATVATPRSALHTHPRSS